MEHPLINDNGTEDFKHTLNKVSKMYEVEETPGIDTRLAPSQLADSVAHYLNHTAEHGVLREHQLETLKDLEAFFRDDNRRGYIELPTGTGKTVLFVELAKALLDTPDGATKPRILVVTPTKDLVHQTIGRTGEKGFGGFAAELKVNSFFSDSSREEREEFTRSDVGVTTYQSFDILKTQPDFIPAYDMGARAVYEVFNKRYEGHLDDEIARLARKQTRSFALPHVRARQKAERFMKKSFRGVYEGAPMLGKFNIIFLDEAHHALPGSVVSEIVNTLPEDTYVIGFTATPDANEMRQLQTILPEKIHSMSLAEAIDDKLLSPVTPIAIKSGLRIDGTDIYNASGEYLDERIGYLASSRKRNEVILDTAEVFARSNIGTIISCIAGGEAAQARMLADRLNARGVSAAAVYSEVSAEDRLKIYDAFEQGDIDVLTFIGVLGEGWDSKRAKAIINARPTRSQIFAKQRIGRVARPGALAYTVDIYDEYESANPPITVADLLTTKGISFGTTFGELTDENERHVATVLGSLRTDFGATILDSIPSAYAILQEKITHLPHMKKGSVYIDGRRFTSLRRISGAHANVQDDMLMRAAELQGLDLAVKQASNNGIIKTVFEHSVAQEVLYAMPVVDPNKYFVDENHQRWASSAGFALLFTKRYPGVSSTDIEAALSSSIDSAEWIPGRVAQRLVHGAGVHYRAIKLYQVTAPVVDMIDRALLDIYQA